MENKARELLEAFIECEWNQPADLESLQREAKEFLKSQPNDLISELVGALVSAALLLAYLHDCLSLTTQEMIEKYGHSGDLTEAQEMIKIRGDETYSILDKHKAALTKAKSVKGRVCPEEEVQKIRRKKCEHDFVLLPNTGGLIDRCTKCGEERA